NHTAFEIMSEAEGFGAITTLLGGGRYNGLTEDLGGPATPGIGFGMGLERLMMALENENIDLPIDDSLDVFMISLGDEADIEAVKIIQKLREKGLNVDKDYMQRKMKAQFKAADRSHAKTTVILAEDELKAQKATVKNMETGIQKDI